MPLNAERNRSLASLGASLAELNRKMKGGLRVDLTIETKSGPPLWCDGTVIHTTSKTHRARELKHTLSRADVGSIDSCLDGQVKAKNKTLWQWYVNSARTAFVWTSQSLLWPAPPPLGNLVMA